MSVLRFGAPPAGAGDAAREATAFAHGSPAVVAQLVANGGSSNCWPRWPGGEACKAAPEACDHKV